jgi:hypothetical protein
MMFVCIKTKKKKTKKKKKKKKHKKKKEIKKKKKEEKLASKQYRSLKYTKNTTNNIYYRTIDVHVNVTIPGLNLYSKSFPCGLNKSDVCGNILVIILSYSFNK